MANFVHRTYNMNQKVNALSFKKGVWTFRKTKGAVNFYAEQNFQAPNTCVTVTYPRNWTDGFCVGEGLASLKMTEIDQASHYFVGYTEYTDKSGRARTSPAMVFFCNAADKDALVAELEANIKLWEQDRNTPKMVMDAITPEPEPVAEETDEMTEALNDLYARIQRVSDLLDVTIKINDNHNVANLLKTMRNLL